MVAQSTVETYDRTTIALHWATAALVILLWVSGRTTDGIPSEPIRTNFWAAHVVFGFALATVLGWRISWRSSQGRVLKAADSGSLRVLATATHYLLYGLLIAVVALGVVNAFVRGVSLFGLVKLPQVGDFGWRKAITNWHGLAANLLLGAALFHAAAALAHHYFRRDGVLRRMAPGGQ